MRRAVAQAKAIEKKRSRYIHLNCGHMTTWECQEFFAVWRPVPSAKFCEDCETWTIEASAAVQSAGDDEPPF